MANTTTVTQESKVEELAVDARFIMRSYKDKDGNDVEFLAFELINPFGDDEIFQNIALKAKWDKYDENRTGCVVRRPCIRVYVVLCEKIVAHGFGSSC